MLMVSSKSASGTHLRTYTDFTQAHDDARQLREEGNMVEVFVYDYTTFYPANPWKPVG